MMEVISQEVQSYTARSNTLLALSNDEIRANKARNVKTYSELVAKLAALAFANPELVLLLRGQRSEYRENKRITLFPKMYREPTGRLVYAHALKSRYATLREKEKRLCEILAERQEYEAYRNRIGRSELARWAILQHYEICPTPLLDVTHSALVASSFAFLPTNRGHNGNYFIYVLGLPQISGSVTVSSTQAIQIVRLSSVCPPETLRPYFQEGYLIGTYPSVDTLDEKLRYERDEMDCARRLVASFRISTDPGFWDIGFQNLPSCAVYPDEQNDLNSAIRSLKTK